MAETSEDLSKFINDNNVKIEHKLGTPNTYLDALNNRETDFILFPNAVFDGIEKYSNVRTVMPVYTYFGIVIYKTDLKFENSKELFSNNKSVLLNAKFFEHYFLGENSKVNIDVKTIESREALEEDILPNYDVIGFFIGVNAPYVNQLLASGEWKILDNNRAAEAGTGTEVEGFCLRNNNFKPFIVPKNFFGSGPKESIQTVTTDYLLLTHDKIDPALVYDIKETILKNKQILSSKNVKFTGIQEAANVSSYVFPLHQGASDYINRNEPTFLERQSEVMGLMLSVVLVLAGFVGRNIKKKKDHFDTFYQKAFNAKNVEDLDAIEVEVLELVVQEKLSGGALYSNFLTIVEHRRKRLETA